MISKTFYYCEKCGAKYETTERAEECEDYHSEIKEITAKVIEMCHQYPSSIHVLFNNGVVKKNILFVEVQSDEIG